MPQSFRLIVRTKGLPSPCAAGIIPGGIEFPTCPLWRLDHGTVTLRALRPPGRRRGHDLPELRSCPEQRSRAACDKPHAEAATAARGGRLGHLSNPAGNPRRDATDV